MVSTTLGASQDLTIILRPNNSLSWDDAKRVFALVATASIVIGLFFALQGYWPILPFAGLELLALGGALYWVQLGCTRFEVISVGKGTVAVEKRAGLGKDSTKRRQMQRWNFQRGWIQVELDPAHHRGHPSRLLLGSHGRKVQIGEFLVEEERAELARQLRAHLRHGSPVNVPPYRSNFEFSGVETDEEP